MNILCKHSIVIQKYLVRRIRSVSTFASEFNKVPTQAAFSLKDFKKHRESQGLFEIHELQSHNGFSTLKKDVTRNAQRLVDEATSPSRTRKLVQVFDELSDELCRVADMADFVRIGHPDSKYRAAAEDACMSVSSIVQQMNTNVELYKSLHAVVNDGDKLSDQPYDDTDRRVAQLLLDDFEQCGIHLDEHTRRKFVEISERIMYLESSFFQKTHEPSRVPVKSLPSHLQHVLGRSGEVTVYSTQGEHQDENEREAYYRAFLYPTELQSQTLDQLLAARDELSKLVGFNSFAERALQNTMTKSPDNANKFLRLLSQQLLPMTHADFSKMAALKQAQSPGSALQPWDVTYFSSLMRRNSVTTSLAEVCKYLSLGACLDGLKLLTERLFGITLHNVVPGPSECWHDSVYKIEVRWLEGNDVIGYIYCDLYERRGKPLQDCHFTIQGGRLKSDGTYQIPKVVLMMNFATPSSSLPTLLTPQQLENLFHEFGHAMHSMIGRTRYQHVTGTRCSTDFAEVPSNLMEYFASDYRVLRQFTFHHETGEPMPEEMANQIRKSKSLFLASEMQTQVFYSALDQALHSSHPLGSSTIDILSDVQKEFYGLPHVPNTAWHLRFGHLVGYGAKYFSYLMSKAIAAKIWQHSFKDDPFSRSNGERYMKEVLCHGGEKPPLEMVEALTGVKPTIESLADSLIEETRSAGNYAN